MAVLYSIAADLHVSTVDRRTRAPRLTAFLATVNMSPLVTRNCNSRVMSSSSEAYNVDPDVAKKMKALVLEKDFEHKVYV